jgi:hypothetical protein
MDVGGAIVGKNTVMSVAFPVLRESLWEVCYSQATHSVVEYVQGVLAVSAQSARNDREGQSGSKDRDGKELGGVL